LLSDSAHSNLLLLQRDIDERVCAGSASGSRRRDGFLRVARGNLAARVFPFGAAAKCAAKMQPFSCVAKNE
jgi:hypothetical protein